jgi:hypothetical protein
MKEPLRHTPAQRSLLYIGNDARGHCLHTALQPRGWQVYLPTAILEALGMYVFYYPDCVVLDAFSEAPLATEVGVHLSSIQAAPVLVITDEARQELWQCAVASTVCVLPHTASTHDVVAAIVDGLEHSLMADAHVDMP